MLKTPVEEEQRGLWAWRNLQPDGAEGEDGSLWGAVNEFRICPRDDNLVKHSSWVRLVCIAMTFALSDHSHEQSNRYGMQ